MQDPKLQQTAQQFQISESIPKMPDPKLQHTAQQFQISESIPKMPTVFSNLRIDSQNARFKLQQTAQQFQISRPWT